MPTMKKNNALEARQRLASLAVFSLLFNKGRKINDIIRDFLQNVIVEQQLSSFSADSIARQLNETYDFTIPIAVVKTALKKMEGVHRISGKYTTDVQHLSEVTQVVEEQRHVERSNKDILERLFKFIEAVKEERLDEEKKKIIVQSFCAFVLDETTKGQYIDEIGAFILSIEEDEAYIQPLQTIRQGVVIYSGIQYNSHWGELGTWRSDLTIFLDTEIMFHAMGYNGELYQEMFNEFLSLVQEINRQEKRVRLRYFEKTKREVEKFFYAAENILKEKKVALPHVRAMQTILENCKDLADVTIQKGRFFTALKELGIEEDDYDEYYEDKNRDYNLEDQQVLEGVKRRMIGNGYYDFSEQDLNEAFRLLNHVHIRRAGRSCEYLDNTPYIFMTGKRIVWRLAQDTALRKNDAVSLSTTLEYITSRFWFKLNKGFGNQQLPKNFDIISKAQTMLARQNDRSIFKKYKKLRNDYKNGQLDDKAAIEALLILKDQTKKPEEITDENASTIVDFISSDDLDQYVTNHDYLDNQVKDLLKEKEAITQLMAEKDLAYEEEIISLREEQERQAQALQQKEQEVERLSQQQQLSRDEQTRLAQYIEDLKVAQQKAMETQQQDFEARLKRQQTIGQLKNELTALEIKEATNKNQLQQVIAKEQAVGQAVQFRTQIIKGMGLFMLLVYALFIGIGTYFLGGKVMMMGLGLGGVLLGVILAVPVVLDQQVQTRQSLYKGLLSTTARRTQQAHDYDPKRKIQLEAERARLTKERQRLEGQLVALES